MEAADYPLVKFARSINKNTAELTTADLSRFTNAWVKQPAIIETIQKIKLQQVRANVVGKQLTINKQESKNMAKKQTIKSFQSAQTSRLPSHLVESNGQDETQVVEVVSEVQDMSEVQFAEEEEIVCDMSLTRLDVDSLLWCIKGMMEEFDVESSIYGASLVSLKESLEGV